jgi:multidrug efflux system outer membrane protein
VEEHYSEAFTGPVAKDMRTAAINGRLCRIRALGVYCAVIVACTGNAAARAQMTEVREAPTRTEDAAAVVADRTQPQLAASLRDAMLKPLPLEGRVLQSWQEALQLVRRQSPQYLQQLEAQAYARAEVRVARAAVVPTLSGQTSVNHEFITQELALGRTPTRVPFENTAAMVAALNWAVDLQKIHIVGTAEANIAMNERTFAEQKRQLTRTLLNGMLATLAATRVAELSRVGVRAALERAQLTESKLHYGSASALDLDRARQDVAAARAELVRADEAARQSRDALGLILGMSIPVSMSDALSPDQLKVAIARDCHLEPSIEHLPDVEAARLRVELAERKSSEVWLQFLPTLSLQAQVQYNRPVTYGPKTNLYVGAALSMPFYDGGARYGLLNEARSNARLARVDLTLARLQALVAITQADRAVTVSSATLAVAQEQRELAESIDERTRTAYRDGIATSLELVTSAQALRQAENSSILARFQLAQAEATAVLAHAECRL